MGSKELSPALRSGEGSAGAIQDGGELGPLGIQCPQPRPGVEVAPGWSLAPEGPGGRGSKARLVRSVSGEARADGLSYGGADAGVVAEDKRAV